MSPNAARQILQLYRRNSTDALDPQIAEALALAARDPELAQWWKDHGARQLVIATKFRQIPVPAGLKEQIISEHAASQRTVFSRRKLEIALLAVIIIFGSIAAFQWVRPDQANVVSRSDKSLAAYRIQMTGLALRGYGMDMLTNNPAAIRTFLAEQQAPADFVLPAGLQTNDIVIVGCAVQGWQTGKVSMICFRTGKPLPPGQTSDLWLFVADRAAIKDLPPANQKLFAMANELITVTWSEGGKVFLLETEGNEATLRKFL